MVGNNYYTYDTIPNYSGKQKTLGEILLPPKEIPDEYVIDPSSILKEKGWKYLKGAKDEPRKGTDDFTYQYKEGPMIFPDALDKPSRTIVTGEGGSTPSRFKHVVKFNPTREMNESLDLETKECQAIRKEFGLAKSEWLRRLTPVELELLNMFPPNHTAGPTDGKRAFFMGNALVIGIIQKLGDALEFNNVSYPGDVDEIISKLIARHENKDSTPIQIGPTTSLVPQLNYTGRMATMAYDMDTSAMKGWRKWRIVMNANRQYCGLLDFQIIDTDLWKDGKMRHDALMAGILENLTPQIITDLYNGKSPHKMNLKSKQLIYATNLWAAFIEQEVNWGSNIFQLHTHFGDTRYMYMKDKWENGKKCEYLEKAVPRDYFCSHIFALFSVLEHDLSNIDTIVNKWKKTYMRLQRGALLSSIVLTLKKN